jgi:hypothetical protein
MRAHIVELLGILIALGLLIFLAFRGFTLLLAAPLAAIVAAALSGEPLLAKWTITFMQATGASSPIFFRCSCSEAYLANSWMTAARRFPSPVV